MRVPSFNMTSRRVALGHFTDDPAAESPFEARNHSQRLPHRLESISQPAFGQSVTRTVQLAIVSW